MNKVERLCIAGAVAPILRDKRRRTIKTIDKAGRVVRTIDDVVLNEALLEREKIEFAVTAEVAKLFCKKCGVRLCSTQKGMTGLCRSHSQQAKRSPDAFKCGGFDGPCPHERVVGETAVRAAEKEGRAPTCHSCGARRMRALQTPEQRSAAALKAAKKWSPEQRRECARKALLAYPPARRSAEAKARLAGLTPEQRRARIQKAVDAANRLLTSEVRSALFKKSWRAKSTEEKRTIVRKRAEGKRAARSRRTTP